MNPLEQPELEVTCPCCGARLKIDKELSRVISHEAPPKHDRSPDLAQAGSLLDKQAERREAHFRESAAAEKIKSDLLARKFEEALKKTKGQPVKPGLRDIDLD
jgi:uncharacterized Zn finger protein (UPF0148 family)